MDDLLDKFATLLEEFQHAVTASNGDREAYAIMRSHNTINAAAREVVDFLIDNDATVTFPAPQHVEPHDGYEWIEDHPDGKNWYPKAGGNNG